MKMAEGKCKVNTIFEEDQVCCIAGQEDPLLLEFPCVKQMGCYG